jgi:hypothetical protein
VIIFINGAFGVGKTTVSRLLQQRLRPSLIFDPEPVGRALQILTSCLPLVRRTDDFQNFRFWRVASTRGIGVTRRLCETVIVPMAFSNRSYLAEFLSHARRFDPLILHFCLTAEHDVVLARLRNRSAAGATAWQLRRSAECCLAHRSPAFDERIATDGRSPAEVTEEIVERVRREGASNG